MNLLYALTNNELEIFRAKMMSAAWKCIRAGEPDVVEDVYITLLVITEERYDRMERNVWNP